MVETSIMFDVGNVPKKQNKAKRGKEKDLISCLFNRQDLVTLYYNKSP